MQGHREGEALTDDELREYQELVTHLDVMNVKRLEGLAILVQHWRKPAREIMAALGIFVSHLNEPEFPDEMRQDGYAENPKCEKQ